MPGGSLDMTQAQEASACQRQQKARRSGDKCEEQEWSIWKHGDGPDGDLRPELRQLGLEVRGVRARRRERPRAAHGKYNSWHSGDPHDEIGPEVLGSIEARKTIRSQTPHADNDSRPKLDLGIASVEKATQSQESHCRFMSLCWWCRLLRDDNDDDDGICAIKSTACKVPAGTYK